MDVNDLSDSIDVMPANDESDVPENKSNPLGDAGGTNVWLVFSDLELLSPSLLYDGGEDVLKFKFGDDGLGLSG